MAWIPLTKFILYNCCLVQTKCLAFCLFIFSAISMGLYNCIMHSQNDSSFSWLQYFTIFTKSLWLILASDSTDYPGFESHWGWHILHPFRTAPWSTHPPVQLELGLFRGGKVDRVWCSPPTTSRATVEYG